MKKFKLIIAITLITAVISSCEKHIFNSIKGKGVTETEVRSLSGFNKISLDIDADVIYTQDSVYFVEISAQQNVLDVIKTEISAGELEIEFTKWVRKHSNITIVIHSPDLQEVDLDGSGNFEANGIVSTNNLELEVSGSGNIVFNNITANSLEAEVSGSGNIYANGGAIANQECKISGSGNIDFEELQATNSNCKISGSGSITVWVTTQLDATISGSGDIRYTGSPIVNTHISGSGSVHHF